MVQVPHCKQLKQCMVLVGGIRVCPCLHERLLHVPIKMNWAIRAVGRRGHEQHLPGDLCACCGQEMSKQQLNAQLVKHREKCKAHLHGLDVEPACMIDAIWLRII